MKPKKREQLSTNGEQLSVGSERLLVDSKPQASSVKRQANIVNRQLSSTHRQLSISSIISIANRRGSMWVLVFLLALTMFIPASGVLAQGYSFQVPELRMQVFVEPDASAKIVYDITFDNSGSPINIVDIGTPHDGYDIGNFIASIDGQPLKKIYTSEYIDTGVEIHLDEHAILAGQTGTLHVEFTMPDMVYEDTTQDGYASLQITPTWFDPSIVYGTSDIWILIHMLPEVMPEDVLYQEVEFTDKAIFEEHTVVGWRYPEGSASEPYLVGTSFPTTGMTRVVEQSLLDITSKWLLDNPLVPITLAFISFVLLAVAFFRFTGFTGFSLFAVLGCGAVYMMRVTPLLTFLILPISILAVVLVERSLKNKKDSYLPAIAQVEGGGIKRGLTAPEAAILLELPLNKVLLLIMFGLLDKQVVSLESDSPFTVKVNEEYVAPDEDKGAERRLFRRKEARKHGVVLRSYEHHILDVLQKRAGKPIQELDFGASMRALVKNVARKMKGFDLSDTQDYYKKIVSRAMEEAASIGDLPEYEKFLDKTWPWVMMADNYSPVLQRRDYTYRPTWVRPYIMGNAGSGLSMPAIGGGSSGSSHGGKTSFADVAASFAGWTEAQTGSLADAISPGGLDLGKAGVVNLSGVDKVTGDIFKGLASSSGSGGSSGGGGCACAGCACACACAGGGR
ncbi:MAG: hypothetical protein CSB13_04825 [Chloroflexi bacterium]|nr:MAG: hypothetical protein CSB13_04825 [Chloroflexota bacterium]